MQINRQYDEMPTRLRPAADFTQLLHYRKCATRCDPASLVFISRLLATAHRLG